jgi:archaeosortase B (VPXXXP-CTERM-specific)
MTGAHKHSGNMKPRRNWRGFSSRGGRKPPQPGRFKLFWARYRGVIRACIIFFVAVGVFIFLYSYFVASPRFNFFLDFTASVTGFFLNLTGQGVEVEGAVVASSRFAFQIVDLCTAIMPMMIFTAAILAFPSRIKEKALGLVLGLLAIFVVNEIRLVSLFFIGVYAPSIFETAHLLVWQSLMILLAIGLWLVWVYKYVRTTAI